MPKVVPITNPSTSPIIPRELTELRTTFAAAVSPEAQEAVVDFVAYQLFTADRAKRKQEPEAKVRTLDELRAAAWALLTPPSTPSTPSTGSGPSAEPSAPQS